mmetsp:Transcript_42797/g.137563  ORF Transcript_42797/g.137563 Transcript_42797/m.137563 type:complete len:139 (-) Transcript_42797:314-730(-)
MVTATDLALLLNTVAFSFFALGHVLAEDGNVAAMGWDVASFMPKKTAVPVELNLLLSHFAAILGSAQLSLVAMNLLAYLSEVAAVKKLAIQVMVICQALCIAMQFYKPAGTGAEGSPASGPIPVIIGLALPTFYANFA